MVIYVHRVRLRVHVHVYVRVHSVVPMRGTVIKMTLSIITIIIIILILVDIINIMHIIIVDTCISISISSYSFDILLFTSLHNWFAFADTVPLNSDKVLLYVVLGYVLNMLSGFYFFEQPVTADLSLIHLQLTQHGQSNERVQNCPVDHSGKQDYFLTNEGHIVLPEAYGWHCHHHYLEAVYQSELLLLVSAYQVQAVSEYQDTGQLYAQYFAETQRLYQALDCEEQMLGSIEPINIDDAIGPHIIVHTRLN